MNASEILWRDLIAMPCVCGHAHGVHRVEDSSCTGCDCQNFRFHEAENASIPAQRAEATAQHPTILRTIGLEDYEPSLDVLDEFFRRSLFPRSRRPPPGTR